jgi:carboxyl-terminal processing protease
MRFNPRWKTHAAWMIVIALLVVPGWAQDGDKGKADKEEADKANAAKKTQEQEYFELMQVFVDMFEQVERNYVKDVDRRKLMEAALRGMLKELDPYSSYIPPEELARFNDRVQQEFGGVGIQVAPEPRTRRILVISPLPNTPAYRAGVRAGDIVMEVEGEDTEDMPISRAVELMKGPPGDTVRLKVRHLGSTSDETFVIERAIIQVSSVLGDKYDEDGQWDFMLDGENGIGYIRLTQFGRKSGEELAATLEKLKKQDMKGLVLDLRFNPGGLLSQAVQISDMFIESGTIVSTEGKNSRPRTWSATKSGTYSDFPMVILVNRFSASASEIVSACLQDHKRAYVVGERSWGKGSVQNIIELESGASALKLTTAGYKRPSGKNIHRFPDAKTTDEWGVMPDEEARFSRKELEDYDRYRRDRDILREGKESEIEFEDRQLVKALEHLRTQLAEDTKKPAADEKKEDAAEKKKAA